MDLIQVWHKSKLIIRLRKQYIVDDVCKYETGNLMILYHCTYSGLLGTKGDVVQNSIGLIRSVGSCQIYEV